MEKISDYEMVIKLSTKKHAKCTICGYHAQEMYIMRRHGWGEYVCRECISKGLLIAALMG